MGIRPQLTKRSSILGSPSLFSQLILNYQDADTIFIEFGPRQTARKRVEVGSVYFKAVGSREAAVEPMETYPRRALKCTDPIPKGPSITGTAVDQCSLSIQPAWRKKAHQLMRLFAKQTNNECAID